MQNDREKFKKEFIKRLIKLSVGIIRLFEKLRENRSLWSIADQVIRSVSSIGANVMEAKASSSRREYIKFFEIALKSANETSYWLVIVRETSKVELSQLRYFMEETKEISNIIAASIITLKGKR